MPEAAPILFIDIEGGWGGSSRSLYYIVKNLDSKLFTPFVVYGKEGPIRRRYSDIGVPAYLFSPLPRIQALEKNNHKSLALFALTLVYMPKFLLFIGRLIKKNKIEIVHLNHESLFFIGICLKLFFKCKRIYHVRTMLPKNIFGRIQIYLAKKTADYLIFISENERKLWSEVYPGVKTAPQSVIYNIFEYEDTGRRQAILEGHKGKFKVACLSTISKRRGSDRLVDVALELKRMALNDVLFAVCGNGEPSYVEGLKSDIRNKGLSDFFLFLGHQEPEAVLSECDCLIKLPRTYNPWGRNIIEAMMCGRPIISLGTYEKFVENGKNGYLLPEFNASEVAEKIAYLSANPEIAHRMGEAGRNKAEAFFDAEKNIAELERVYKKIGTAAGY